MTIEQRELFKDLHCYDFSDFCLKDGELSQISERVYIIYDLDSFYIKYFDNNNTLISSYRYTPWEHIHLLKIKKDLIKKEKWNWLKNILNFKKDKKWKCI
jgi:hypothetical protein